MPVKKRRRLFGSLPAVIALVALLGAPAGAEAQSVAPSIEYGVPDGEDASYPIATGLYGGAQVETERYTGSTGIGHIGGTFKYQPFARFVIDARFTNGFAKRTYLARSPAGDSPVQRRTVRESHWDTSLNFGYEVLGDRALEGDLALEPYAGIRFLGYANDAYPRWGGAPRLGFLSGFRATEGFRLEANAAVDYVAFGRTESNDMLGAPGPIFSYSLSSLFRFGERYSFRLAVTGESMWREHTYRQSFGALGGIEFRFPVN